MDAIVLNEKLLYFSTLFNNTHIKLHLKGFKVYAVVQKSSTSMLM